MKKTFLGLMFIIVFCFGSVQEVRARYENAFTGYDILEFCTADKYSVSESICVGFTNGVHEGYQIGAMLHGITKKAFCKPEGVSRGQIVLIVVKYLKDNPERLHYLATTLILEAMSEALPCHD